MSQCYGKTKVGDRCKRSTREGSRFCAIHADQALDSGASGLPAGRSGRQPVDAIAAVAAASLVLVAVLAVRRLFRLV